MGGELRVHLDSTPEAEVAGRPRRADGSGGRTWDIEPVLDRLVLFRSDLVDHEVSHKSACVFVCVCVCLHVCLICSLVGFLSCFEKADLYLLNARAALFFPSLLVLLAPPAVSSRLVC